MNVVKLFLSAALLTVLAGCSVVPTALIDAGQEKLVAARHPQCDKGPALVHYLATGDNGGVPDMDQEYGDLVGTLNSAQIRAKADDWIEACDAKADAAEQLAAANAQAEVQEAQDAAQAAQQETEEAAQAARVRAQQNKRLAAECADASGRFDATEQRCYSTVTGNPSGIAGEACTGPSGNPSYLFPCNGNFIHPNSHFPGCWT